MPANDERREAARKLRDIGYLGNFDDVVKAIGFPNDMTWRMDEFNARLADLIEPSGYECVPGECPLNVCHDNDRIDRERLLAIATMMAADSVRSTRDQRFAGLYSPCREEHRRGVRGDFRFDSQPGVGQMGNEHRPEGNDRRP